MIKLIKSFFARRVHGKYHDCWGWRLINDRTIPCNITRDSTHQYVADCEPRADKLWNFGSSTVCWQIYGESAMINPKDMMFFFEWFLFMRGWKSQHCNTGWWLTYPSEKYEFVSWDDDIPNIWKNRIHVPNHQSEHFFSKIHGLSDSRGPAVRQFFLRIQIRGPFLKGQVSRSQNLHETNTSNDQWIGLRENLQETMVFTIK